MLLEGGPILFFFCVLAQTRCLMKSGVNYSVVKGKDNILRWHGLWSIRVRDIISLFHSSLLIHTMQFSLITRLLRVACYVTSCSHLA